MESFDFKKCKSIAIMGGTFDPPHNGHLVTAQAVYDTFNVDKVVIIPLGDAPHKERQLSPANDRYNMVSGAIVDNKAFAISDMEINRHGKTYTVDTIEEIKRLNPDLIVYFIIGADEVNMIETWKSPTKLLKMCRFIAVSRPGYKVSELIKKIESVRKKFDCEMYFLEVPALDISSSELREKVKEHKSIKYLVPKETEKYINEHNLYE